jgi:hypothetical protein
VEDPTGVAKALAMYGAGIDFSDALHLISCGPAQRFGTFDSKLARKARRHDVVEVVSI